MEHIQQEIVKHSNNEGNDMSPITTHQESKMSFERVDKDQLIEQINDTLAECMDEDFIIKVADICLAADHTYQGEINGEMIFEQYWNE